MEFTASFLSLAALIIAFLFLTKKFLQIMTTPKLHLPPSVPLALPVIGHLHLLKLPLHNSLAGMAARHGPLLLLRFGSRRVLHITTAELANECFTTNDVVFANRPKIDTGKYLTYDYTTLGAAPYGAHWRNLRRLTTVELFCLSRVTALSHIRTDNVRCLLRQVYTSLGGGGSAPCSIELKPLLWEMVTNITIQIIGAKQYFGESATVAVEERERFQRVLQEMSRLSEVSNPEDFLPFTKLLGLNGHRKELEALQKEMDELFQEMVDDRRRLRGEDDERKGLIDVLLSLQETEPDYYTDKIIKGLILILLQGGIEGSRATMEWSMSLLLNNPRVLKKLRIEIKTSVGYERLMADSDLANLPFLNNVIKETLRLFPPGPILPPHQSSSECKIQGYDIPVGTFLFVNMFALNRDPSVWSEPTEFNPERFEVGEGEGHSFIPFGSGRRKCPGELLATRIIGLALGTLIQCFEWERVAGRDVDLTMVGSLTISKAVPLQAMCQPREEMLGILGQL